MDGKVVIGTEIDTNGFEKEIALLESKLNEVSATLQMASEDKTLFTTTEIMEMEAEAEKLGRKLTSLREKQSKIENPPTTNGLIDFLKKAGKETEKNVKKVGKWALAIFGIRSAYMLVRQSMSTLSQYNEDLANKLSNIRLVLATALEPIINRIISLVVTLLGYLNYVMKAWFNIDLFARASELSSQKMNKDLKGGAKSAKEINKQLAGFDEMNIIQDNSSSGGGADLGAGEGLKFNLPEAEIPEWLKWIVNHKNEILAVMAGVAGGLLAWKLGLSGIQALGIGVAISGVVYAIQGLIEFMKDPTFENFGKIIQGIGIAVIGLGIAFFGLPGIITGVVVLIVGTIIKHWNEIKAFLDKGITWLKDSIEIVKSVFGNTIGAIYEYFVDGIETILEGFNHLFTGIKTILIGIIDLVKAIISGDWKKAWESAKTIFSGVFYAILGIIEIVVGKIKAVIGAIGAVVITALKLAISTAINALLWRAEIILNAPINAINGLIGIINKLPGINLGRLPTFKLPRLAKGGIINMPGKGVPVGSAIAGEKGQEGVIPLTDSQQMELLGEAIGKYITINASITNTMNGRVISRELQKIQNENDFAYNR